MYDALIDAYLKSTNWIFNRNECNSIFFKVNLNEREEKIDYKYSQFEWII